MQEKQLKAFIAQAFSLQNTADRAVLDVDALLGRVMLDVRQMVEALPEEGLLRDKAWNDLQPIVQELMAPYGEALKQAVEQQVAAAVPDMRAYAVREAEYADAEIKEGLGALSLAYVLTLVRRARVGKSRFRELFTPQPRESKKPLTEKRFRELFTRKVGPTRLLTEKRSRQPFMQRQGPTRLLTEKRFRELFMRKQGPITPWTEQMFRVVDRNVRSGIIQGLSTQQIADLVVHETISKGVKGVSLRGKTSVRTIRAQAMAMTRTVVQDVNHQVKESLWHANEDALKNFVFQWSAVLDSRTCGTCASLDGRTWKERANAPRPPMHVNCRCGLLVIDPKDESLNKDRKVGTQISETPYKTGYKTKVKVKGKRYYRKAVEFSGNDYGDYLASSNLLTQTEFFGGGPVGERRARYFRKQIDEFNKDPQDILASMLTGPTNAKKFIPVP